MAEEKESGFQAYILELQSLDAENYGEWSKPVQWTSWVIIALVVIFLGYFLCVKPLKDNIEASGLDRITVLNEFTAQNTELKSALQYKEQLDQIEERFQEQLLQLPKGAEISGLVEDISASGRAASLKIEDISLDIEQKKEIFIEQPIKIEATGDFHAFGRFIEAISSLPRIVTVESFKAEVEKEGNSDVPKIKYHIKASTYRYLDPGLIDRSIAKSDRNAAAKAGATE